MRDFICGLVLSALCAIGGAICGYEAASTKCELEKAQFHKTALEQEQKAAEKKHDTENLYKDAVVKSQSDVFADVQAIDAHWNDLSAHDLNADDDSVHTDSAGSIDAVRKDPEPPAGISKTQCRCPGQNRAKLQRLYERQLVIAKDCDITATYYNRLLELYQMVSNNGN